MDINALLQQIGLAGGSATLRVGGPGDRAWIVGEGSDRRLVRVRSAVSPDRLNYESTWRATLAKHKVPVVGGATDVQRVTVEGGTCEIFSVANGQIVSQPSPQQLTALGQTLGTIHKVGTTFAQVDPAKALRPDHPSLLQPVLKAVAELAKSDTHRKAVQQFRREVDELSFILDDMTYGQLESTVILGDLHVGQVLFDGDGVSAVLSLDRASKGPVLRDLADGLMYCCTRRSPAMDPTDPWSLTAAWQVDDDRTEAFLRGYNSVNPLPRSWPWLGAMMLSRWFESRLILCGNISSDRQLEFVLRDIDRPVDLLKRHVQAWLKLLIGRL